jgi:putative redox protein
MTNANITWVDGMQFVAQGDSGHPIVMDVAEEAGGHASGARPMEVLLMGVLGCTAMDVISILRKKRQPVQGLKVFATAARATEHPMYFTKLHLEYVAYGDVQPEALARSIQLSEEKYCSAIATVRGSTQITSSYRVEKAR